MFVRQVDGTNFLNLDGVLVRELLNGIRWNALQLGMGGWLKSFPVVAVESTDLFGLVYGWLRWMQTNSFEATTTWRF